MQNKLKEIYNDAIRKAYERGRFDHSRIKEDCPHCGRNIEAGHTPLGFEDILDGVFTELGSLVPRAWHPADTAPHNRTILVHYRDGGKDKVIRGIFIPRFTEESGPDSDNDEYDEKTDCYYVREGWYECIENWDDYGMVFIHDQILNWMPLPEVPSPQFLKEGRPLGCEL